MLPVLDAEEQRVLGCLLEKQVTVPDSYPLSLNALRTACNQSSSREPVVDWDEPTVESIARRLRERELVRVVWADKGRRTLKYHQLLTDSLELPNDQLAILTVLLLRGPQAPGELKTRTERLYAFDDRAVVEATLSRMASRDLVAELPRRTGDRDSRWTHLLGAAPAVTAAPVDVKLEDRDDEVRQTYAAVAHDYAESHDHEPPPFERWLLATLAETTTGPVIDVGCGPGFVTAFLREHGADAAGIDLTPEMIDEARHRFPDADFQVADLRHLIRPAHAPGWGAVISWYSLIHLAPDELPAAVATLARPLADDGTLLLAMQTGGGSRRVTDWLGHEVGLTLVLHDRSAVIAALHAARFTDITWYHRGPYQGELTEKLYVVARR